MRARSIVRSVRKWVLHRMKDMWIIWKVIRSTFRSQHPHWPSSLHRQASLFPQHLNTVVGRTFNRILHLLFVYNKIVLMIFFCYYQPFVTKYSHIVKWTFGSTNCYGKFVLQITEQLRIERTIFNKRSIYLTYYTDSSKLCQFNSVIFLPWLNALDTSKSLPQERGNKINPS